MTNPQYINSLKAGIKTTIITFVTTILAALPGLMDAVKSWTVDGNPPNMDSYQKLGLAAVLALIVGLGNTVMRFLQAAGVPFIGALFDKLLGVIPDYLPPDEGPVDDLGDNAPGLNRDAPK